jgi:sugar phosphate permease
MVVFAAGFVLFSRLDGPVAFFLTFFMMAVGTSLGGYLPISVAIVTWFRRRRSLALSISGMGMALGGLSTPLVIAALTRYGWRTTALASGLIVLVLGLLLAQLMRHPPETYGLRPDGDPRPAPEARTARPTDTRSYTAREAMATRAFWYISLGHAAALLVVSAVMVHMVIHVTERLGYSLPQAGAVVALLTVMQLTGQLTGGWLGDRFSKRWICAGCMLGHAVALMVLGLATAFWMVLAFAVLHGVSWGMRGPLMAAIRADYFGSGSFGMISGVSSMVIMFGMMLGPLVAGILADRTGSYVPGFSVLAAFAAAGSIAFVRARRPAPAAGPRAVA